VERTARGRADAKPKGAKFGRASPHSPFTSSARLAERLAAGETQLSVARSYNVSKSTISQLTA
jgi:DNA invertase Pin-like site-specific DNA recombinase